MRRTPLLLLLLVILISRVVKFLLFPARTAKASPQELFGVCVSSVPKEWEQFKGGYRTDVGPPLLRGEPELGNGHYRLGI
jgi:hypothetical protein